METSLCLTVAAFGLASFNLSTAVVQAQFNYTTNNRTITIARYTGFGGAVTIPSTINGLPVTSIGSVAFLCSTNLTSVTIPDSVTSIDDGGIAGAFCACANLTNVTIGNNVTNIGTDAFYDCTSLISVTIPNSVARIGDLAFAGCTSLSSVTIGNGVTSIGEYAFYHCDSLRTVCFEGNAPSFGPDIFNGANNATVYYLPGTTGWGTTSGGRPTAQWVLLNPLVLDNSVGIRNNQFGFIISWATNIPVVVEASVTLANPTWSPISTNTLTNGASYFSDPQWTNYPARFYRLRSP